MISIVIPCYNCEKTIDYCLNSIKNQTQSNIEIILVDDGSTDATAAICEKEQQLDKRIHVIHQKNQGLMNAWKAGVRVAEGTHIAFCDSDDYIDSNMLEKLEEAALTYDADIVICGMQVEYADGSRVFRDNRLAAGVYSKTDIQEKILPEYFSDGGMESNICISQRGVKLFKRDILIRNFKLLDDRITVGEDRLTTFAAVLCANRIVCIRDFYPYHYIRNNVSMIGAYDRNRFQKVLLLREALLKVTKKYNYCYESQIEDYFISTVLLGVKKEICRNREDSLIKICRNIKAVREDKDLNRALYLCTIKRYKVSHKIFALLFKNRMYFSLYLFTKIFDLVGIGKA